MILEIQIKKGSLIKKTRNMTNEYCKIHRMSGKNI